jgi:hypothetical protein
VNRWDRESLEKRIERMQQAQYDVLRALEIIAHSLTDDGGTEHDGYPHQHPLVAPSPRKRAIDHLESAARLAGIGHWTYDYLIPEFQTASQKDEKSK